MPDIPPHIRFHKNLKADTAKKFRMDASEPPAFSARDPEELRSGGAGRKSGGEENNREHIARVKMTKTFLRKASSAITYSSPALSA